MKTDAKKIFDTYEKKYDQLFRIAVSIMGNIPDAEEVLQDLAVVIMEKQEIFQGANNVNAYLFSSVRNIARNHFNKRKRNAHISTEEIAEPVSFDADDSFKLVEDREVIQEIISKYPPEIKEALVMNILDGYSIREIANKLGMNPDTLKQKLYRMKKKIAREYLLFTIFMFTFK